MKKLYTKARWLKHSTSQDEQKKEVRKQHIQQNKGSQNTVPKNKRPKYEAPWREYPETEQDLENADIQANHLEAQNAALRRGNSAYRRRTNTYAKCIEGLQRTLDVHQIIHNFVRQHWTDNRSGSCCCLKYH